MARQWHAKGPKRVEAAVLVLFGVSVLLLPVACRQRKAHARAAEVDSKNLKQTVVVATLDCPLPEHKNVIWCATFQMAWDKLKQDVIGEPIRVLQAQELADRLNRSQFPIGSIEEESYYASAGFVKNGIIEQIQTEMRRRFPSEPVPIFDARYKALPEVIAAYAYVNVNVEFEHPYYTYSGTFEFSGSNGTRTRVKAFGDRITKPDANFGLVRRQVEVLYYEDGGSSADQQFAVDLSRLTHPYQIILARMPRRGTFGESVRMLRERIAAFGQNPDYETLCKLRPRDSLIAPDVLYQLTHHFDDLLGKHLGNPQRTDTFIFEAMQRIDFTLSRTGAVLKSAARGAVKAAVMAKPRLLHFDRPFLICVQKREPNATPFFLMWVDNAELMKPYGSGGKRS
jgi:hypothetical protein